MLALSRCTGPGEIGVPEQMRGVPWSGVPPNACADGGAAPHRGRQRSGREAGSRPLEYPGMSGGGTTFLSSAVSERIGNRAKMAWRVPEGDPSGQSAPLPPAVDSRNH